jgi:asparagine synthase (glutamine-hydrolysing)
MNSPLQQPDLSGSAIVAAMRQAALTYLDERALEDLFDLVVAIEARGAEGVLVEAGCALGGSAIVLAAAKAQQRPLLVFDVFGLIPPPGERDGSDVHARYETIASGQSTGIAGRTYYGYETDLLTTVRENFARHGRAVERHNVSLIKGLYRDSLRIEQPVALAHVDCDWYDSVIVCLRRIEPYLVPGGVLVIDDYYSWSGCRRAVDDYFTDKRDRFDFIDRSRLQIVRR